MSGAHRVRGRRAQVPAVPAPQPQPVPAGPEGLLGYVPFEAVPFRPLPHRRPGAVAEAVAAGRRGRQDMTAQTDIPTTLLAALKAWTPAPPTWTPQPVPGRPQPHHGVSAIWVRCITYPDPDGSAEDYAETMRHISFATGTASRYDTPDAWPRRAIEAGTETPA